MYPFFCTVCFMLSYILDMQLTLPIHVNPLTAIKTSHLLTPGAWHMTPIIGHQRRLAAAILGKLTCDFRKLPPEHNIYPNILFPRMSLYCQTWLISLTFVLYAETKETLIRFFVSVVREKYIEIVLFCTWWIFTRPKLYNLVLQAVQWKHFPFNHTEGDNEFTMTVDQFMSGALMPAGEFLHPDSMIFDPFEINEHEDQIVEYNGELVPDRNDFNQFSHQLSKNSNYYNEDSFNTYIKTNSYEEGELSFIHSNIRSFPANLTAFMSYMSNIDCNFSIMGFSETWLNSSTIDTYDDWASLFRHFWQSTSHKNACSKMDVKQCICIKFNQNLQCNTNNVRYYRIHQHTVLLKQTSK